MLTQNGIGVASILVWGPMRGLWYVMSKSRIIVICNLFSAINYSG